MNPVHPVHPVHPVQASRTCSTRPPPADAPTDTTQSTAPAALQPDPKENAMFNTEDLKAISDSLARIEANLGIVSDLLTEVQAERKAGR